MKEIHEGSAVFQAGTGTISRQLAVFYNPYMERNRTISVLLLNALPNNRMRIADPLAGSGVRTIRFWKELKKGKISELMVNDASPQAIAVLKKNLKKNKVKATVLNTEANKAILQSGDFDYIDIDPFGYPGYFLDASTKRLRKDGILAVTATDTAALSGTYPKAGRRKYWAETLRNDQMHEIGMRILIRRVQLIGASYDKALIPVLSYVDQHYYRCFFLCKKGKKKVDAVLDQHKVVLFREGEAGPLWTGSLGDAKLARKMAKQGEKEFLSRLAAEYGLPLGFYTIPSLTKLHNISRQPRFDDIIAALKAKKQKVARTHFTKQGLKTSASEKEMVGILRKLYKNK